MSCNIQEITKSNLFSYLTTKHIVLIGIFDKIVLLFLYMINWSSSESQGGKSIAKKSPLWLESANWGTLVGLM